jgi:hypothetical protein
MRRHYLGVLACLGAAIAAAGVLACSVGNGGQGQTPDASVADASAEPDVVKQEAAVEAEAAAVMDAQDAQEAEPPPPTCTAQSCGGACCGGRCVSQTCAGCDAGTHFCPFSPGVRYSNGYCVAVCSGCKSAAITLGTTCFDCSSGVPAAKCANASDTCPQSVPAGACTCPSRDAGECPGPTQACQDYDSGAFRCITP